MVELACETDFVAKNEDFKKVANEIAMHCASSQPLYITAENVPQEVLNQEKRIVLSQNPNKPEQILGRIVDGNMKKFNKVNTLMNQVYVRDSSLTISDLVNDLRNKVNENIFIKSVIYAKVGVLPTILTM